LLLRFDRLAISPYPLTSTANMHFALVLCFAWIAAIECLNAASCERINREHTGSMAVLGSVYLASGATALLLALLGIPLPGMTKCAVDVAFLFIASAIVNISFRAIFNAQRPRARIAVVEAHTHAGGVSWTMIRKRVSYHEISGAIRLETVGREQPARSAHSLDELVREIRREALDGVLISAPSADVTLLSQIMDTCGGMGAPVRLVTGSNDSAPLRQSISNANCLYLLNTGAAPTRSWAYSVLKRGFDLIFSLIAILAGLPIIALIALAIKISSKGSIFFVQDRVGWNGKVFRMCKFRTMHTIHPCESDTRWSEPDDARRTAVGRFLRKFSLDELPQFFNVLKGDMSVVGPRPERPYFVNSFRSEIDEYHRRHQIKVGITGWAQVNGLRGDTCIRTRVMYDLYYLQNWGLVFDLKIIVRTVFCVIYGRNAD